MSGDSVTSTVRVFMAFARAGRLVLDAPTDLPDGTMLTLVPVDDLLAMPVDDPSAKDPRWPRSPTSPSDERSEGARAVVIDRSHAVLKSCALVGIDAEIVDVECTITRGLPQYNVVGLPAHSVKEGATRIQNALLTVGYDMPLKKVTVNLAPPDLRKPGSSFDLPIALAVLVAEGVIAGDAFADLLVMGELGLDGTVRSVHGALAAALRARAAGRGVARVDAHGRPRAPP